MFSNEVDTMLKQKAKSTSIKGMTWEDIWQELRLAVWEAMPSYNSKLATEKTFADRVARNTIKDLIRYAMRESRGGGKNDVSLDEMLDKGHI